MKDSIVNYDRESDCLYINWANEKTIQDSKEIQPGIVLDYDNDNNVIGIEILSVKSIIENDLQLLAEQYLKLCAQLSTVKGVEKAKLLLEKGRLLRLIGVENIHLIMDVEKEWELLAKEDV